MFKLIPAKEKHLDQIVPLLISTGYWSLGLKHNNLNLNPHEFMREYIARPHLHLSTIAIKNTDEDQVLGVIVCGSPKEISLLPNFSELVDPRIIELFGDLHEMPNSYYIKFLAVSPSFRKQGIARKLFEFAELKQEQEKIENLSLITFGCQTSAIKFYIDRGMIITEVKYLSEKLPFPSALYFTKNKKLTQMQDFFDTESFKNFDLLDLGDSNNETLRKK